MLLIEIGISGAKHVLNVLNVPDVPNVPNTNIVPIQHSLWPHYASGLLLWQSKVLATMPWTCDTSTSLFSVREPALES